MFCKNCGEYIRSKSSYGPRCKEMLIYSRKNDLDKELTEELYEEHDKSGFGLIFISFVIPIIGFILYCINKAHLPRKSNVIMASTILGCIVWCAMALFFNVVYGMNTDIFSSIQEFIMSTL